MPLPDKKQAPPDVLKRHMEQFKRTARTGNCGLGAEHIGVLKKSHQVKAAAVFDLDGTLRPLPDRSGTPWVFATEPFPDVEEKLWQLRDEGYLVVVVSNQAGVAFGYNAPFETVENIAQFRSSFKKDPIHFLVACHFHPKGTVAPYNHRSLFRKPDVGMLALVEDRAWKDGIVVDWDSSFVVGDRFDDANLAENAGIVEFYWSWNYFGRKLILNQTIQEDIAEMLGLITQKEATAK